LVADTKEGTVEAPSDLRATTEAITRVEVALEEGIEIWHNAYVNCSKKHHTSTQTNTAGT